MKLKKIISTSTLAMCMALGIVTLVPQTADAVILRIDDDTALNTNDKSFAITAQLAPNIWEGKFNSDIYSHGGAVTQSYQFIFHLNNETGKIDLQMVNSKTGEPSEWEQVKFDKFYPNTGGSLTYKYITAMTYMNRPDVLPKSKAETMFQYGHL